MKITKATYWTEKLALTRPYTIAYERIESVQNLFVHLQAEDGSVGLGVASPAEEVTGEGVAECRQALADNLEGLLPRKRYSTFKNTPAGYRKCHAGCAGCPGGNRHGSA